MKIWIKPKYVLEILLVLVLVFAAEAFLTRGAARGMAPPIQARTLDGAGFSLDALAGSPAVVHFWATWCRICELEQGMVERLAKGYPFISVAMQSGTDAEVAAWMNERDLSYPVINDPLGELARRYGVRAVPASFVLDARGQVRFVTRGYTSGAGMRARLWLAGWFR